MDVDESDTVDRLKLRIQEQLGTPADQQVLVFDSKRLDDGDCTLASCGIGALSTLYLVQNFKKKRRAVTVKTITGKLYTLDVEEADTISDIKNKIREQSGELPENQRLIFGGQQLEDANLLSKYIDGSQADQSATIYLVPRRSMRIDAKTLSGKIIALYVDESDTIQVIKKRIWILEGHPPEAQRLIFAGQQLEDSKTLAEYGVKDESILHVVLRHINNPPLEDFNRSVTHARQSDAYSNYQPACDTTGACGLSNLGNTCFMNAILQALSNTVPLRQYCRSGNFKEAISNSPLSMNGRLANSFADLLTKMWEDSRATLSPFELRQLIAEKRPEFGGYQQHDAQEMLTFLLDYLHEDVNRAPYPRPVVEDPSTDGKTDLQVADEARSGNLRRNNSRIMELFQFQLRSEIDFPEANDKSLKFDPMMYLSLPVPKPPNWLNVTVVHQDYPRVAPTRHWIDIAKEETFRDLQSQLFTELPGAGKKVGSFCYAFASMYEYQHKVTRFFRATSRIAEVTTFQALWAFEVPLAPDVSEDDLEFVAVSRRKRSPMSNSLGSACPHFTSFAPPYVLAVRRSDSGANAAASAAEVLADIRSAAGRFMAQLGVQDNALEVSVTWVQQYCSDEGAELSAEGEFEVPQIDTLAVNFLDVDAVLGRAPMVPESQATTGDDRGPPDKEVDIEQCLDAFTRAEELSPDDWVKCKKTGKFERSLKKLDIWTAPECLLVHLKRFRSELLAGPVEKIETDVKAPMDLDLSRWLRGPREESGAQYKLYAVVNHSGSLSFGHYTAYCRVGDGAQRQWHHFNDSTVTRAVESEVVSKAAYILFYERVHQAGAAAHETETSSSTH